MLDADYIVARFGIVAIFPILFWTHVLFLGFHHCGKKVWETIFFEKKKLQVLQIPHLHRQKKKISIVANWNPYLSEDFVFLGRKYLTFHFKESTGIV